MAALFVGFLAGAAVAVAAWVMMRTTFDQPLFARRNHRGVDVPVGVGVLIALATVAVAAGWRVVVTLVDPSYSGSTSMVLVGLLYAVVVAAGFGLLGLFDDLAASGSDRGFTGHLRALRHGRLTTGGVKLFAGGLLSLLLAVPSATSVSFGRLVLAGAVISLAANLGNLFDRAPGRCTKVSVVAGAALFACAAGGERSILVGVAVVLGAAVGLGFFDLGEKLMLGDAGSNVLGAALGWGLVATTGVVAQGVVLAVLVVLNVLSEKVSFSAVIDRVAPLRALDRLGRRSFGD